MSPIELEDELAGRRALLLAEQAHIEVRGLVRQMPALRRMDPCFELVASLGHVETHLGPEEPGESLGGEPEVVERMGVQRERLVRLDEEESADAQCLHDLV